MRILLSSFLPRLGAEAVFGRGGVGANTFFVVLYTKRVLIRAF